MQKSAAQEFTGFGYDQALYDQLTEFKETNNLSDNRLAALIGCSPGVITKYMDRENIGDLPLFQRQIQSFLDGRQGLSESSLLRGVCRTGPFETIGETLRMTQLMRVISIILADSGTGKTISVESYVRVFPTTLLITADITRRTARAVLKMLFDCIGEPFYHRTTDQLLDRLIQYFQNSKRLLIVDDSHFLSWACFEAVRRLYDACGLAIAFLGQHRTLDQMRGHRGMLYDQLMSRICLRRDQFPIVRGDVKMIADSIVPGLDKDCIDFLFERAQGQGRFRTVRNVLNLSLKFSEMSKSRITLETLRQADSLLVR